MSIERRQRWRARLLLLALGGVAVACVRRAPAPSGPRAGESLDGGVSTAVGQREPTAVAPLEALTNEIAKLADYHSWFGFQTQKKPARFHPIPTHASAPFPGTTFAEVRAYTFRFDNGSLNVDQCVVAPDGTLCASVNTPGKPLSADQVKRLLAVVPELSPSGRSTNGGRMVKRPASHCEFDPHHAFVFFDAGGRPVGELEVCLSCGQLLQVPTVKNLDGDLFEEEADGFRALCSELGLGGCFLGTRAYEDRRRNVPPASFVPPTADRSLPVGGDRRLEDTNDEERRRLCLWSANEATATRFWRTTTKNDPHGFKCPSGEEGTVTMFDWASCVASFPRCNTSVQEVSACVKWRLATPMCPDPNANAGTDPCAKVNACTWGVRRDVRTQK